MNAPTSTPAEALDAWLAKVSETLELGLDADEVPTALIRDVAADISDHVTPTAAPLSTFLLGLALGQRSQGETSLKELAEQLTELANKWTEPASN